MQLRKEFKKLKIKNIKIQSFNGMPKTPSNDNRTEDLNIKITDKIDELYKKIEQEQAEQEFLTRAIESLKDPIENIVMRLLYINNLSWSEVERRLNCSPATIKRVVDRAFVNLSKFFENNDSV